ncbi:MAG: flavin-containing monooxygenase [Rhizomicrobium sp.]
MAQQTAPKAGLADLTADEAVIAAAIGDGHLPSLMAAAAQIAGNVDLIDAFKAPLYDFFGDGQGGYDDATRARISAEILSILCAYRDRGCTMGPALSAEALHRLMSFVAGAEIPDRYIPYLEEEMEFSGYDERMPDFSQVPAQAKENFRVLIIGAGMSGLLAAIRLSQAGIPFIIVERNKDVGGTWLVNSYPGCRVDNPNHMYCYSFAPNHDWPQHYSTQPVLEAYFRQVSEKYGIREQVRFETTVEECVYDEQQKLWRARLHGADGNTQMLAVNAVITATGQLREPKLPDIKGVGSFKGPAFHSARWDHSVDLTGKRVAVIGTGASAFQFVPEIAPRVGALKVFQRTPPWLGPTPNYHDDVAQGQKFLLKHVPFYAQWYRFWIFWMLTDGILPMVKRDPSWTSRTDSVSAENDMLRELLTQYMQAQVADRQDLAAAVIPNYPMGGKRSVRDNGVWLSTLKRDNVELITDPIAEIVPQGLITRSGRHVDVDVLIYGTGFQASEFLAPMRVKGRGGVDLHQMWDGDPRAYLGITVPGFPNFFMMYGPNTNIVVNGSIIFFSECEMRYIASCIATMLERGSAALEVKKQVHDAFNEKIDRGNLEMAWGAPQVSSWYKNAKGRVTQNWPFLLVDYWQATRRVDPDDYQFESLMGEAAE